MGLTYGDNTKRAQTNQSHCTEFTNINLTRGGADITLYPLPEFCHVFDHTQYLYTSLYHQARMSAWLDPEES